MAPTVGVAAAALPLDEELDAPAVMVTGMYVTFPDASDWLAVHVVVLDGSMPFPEVYKLAGPV